MSNIEDLLDYIELSRLLKRQTGILSSKHILTVLINRLRHLMELFGSLSFKIV